MKMADMMYRLVLRAQFENQGELTKAIEGLNQLQVSGAKVNVTMGGVGRASTDSLQSLGSTVLRVGFMFNMLESALMRQEMATMMAENAQNRLNDAIARYGVNSEQANRAAKQMESETAYLTAANMRANVSYGLMATTLILQSGLLREATREEFLHTLAKNAGAVASGAKTIIEGIETAGIWLKNAATSAAITLQAMLEPYLVPIMLGAAAAVATGVAAYGLSSKQEGGYISQTKPYLLHAGEWVLSKESIRSIEKSTFMPSSETGGGGIMLPTFNFETHLHLETDLDAALKEQNRRIKDEYRRNVS